MSDGMPSLQEKIAQIKASFVGQLPGRLAEARRLYERVAARLDDREAAVELHRFLHSLKGTGRSFGFIEMGDAAAQGENVAVHLLDAANKAPPDYWQELLGACLDGLDRCVADLQAGGGAAGMSPGFSMPRAAAEEAEKGDHVVYMCDDDTALVDQMCAQLSCFGYEASGFTDAQALRDAIAQRKPDALILDIGFPVGEQDGTELLADLRRDLAPQVPAIFLSARSDFKTRLNAVMAGGQAYFQKPARALDLVAVLDELTQQHSQDAYRVLIVDDEPDIAGFHALLLQEAGMRTHEVNDPAAVLDALREFRPDIVLIDMYMPGCTGQQLAQVIRQLPEYVGLPIVYLSSETDKSKQLSAMRVGAEGFLTKPVVPENLITAVAIRAERMRTLRTLMAKDSLTGLFNHTTTTQLLENALGSARRHGGHLCFAMIDIDNFKSINDTHGHPVGDQVILALARVLQQRLRNTDIVGRYGGEEFAVILDEATEDKALELLDRLREDFNHIVFHAGDVDFSCSFSAGIAGFPQFARIELLREAADKALYQAKRGGRNRIAVATGNMP